MVIITPSGMHNEHSYEILNNYKKCWIEKPIALKIDHVSKLFKIAKNNLRIFPIFQNRYNKAVRMIQSSLKKIIG